MTMVPVVPPLMTSKVSSSVSEVYSIWVMAQVPTRSSMVHSPGPTWSPPQAETPRPRARVRAEAAFRVLIPDIGAPSGLMGATGRGRGSGGRPAGRATAQGCPKLGDRRGGCGAVGHYRVTHYVGVV